MSISDPIAYVPEVGDPTFVPDPPGDHGGDNFVLVPVSVTVLGPNENALSFLAQLQRARA